MEKTCGEKKKSMPGRPTHAGHEKHDVRVTLQQKKEEKVESSRTSGGADKTKSSKKEIVHLSSSRERRVGNELKSRWVQTITGNLG